MEKVCSPRCALAFDQLADNSKKERVWVGKNLQYNTIDTSSIRTGPMPKKKKTKAKTKKISKLKKSLWDLFSLHQKLVYSVDGLHCDCYTCGACLTIGTSNCQGGHCLSKAACSNIYFDERAVRPQCYRCNINFGGMHYEFNEKLKMEIGMEAWTDMYEKRLISVKRNWAWYEEQIEYYQQAVKELRAVRLAT